MLNVSDIARDVGISNDTAKRWLKILENLILYFSCVLIQITLRENNKNS